MPKTSIHLLANGERHTLNMWPMSRLLDVIREDLPLTGTKDGCGEGEPTFGIIESVARAPSC